MALSIALSATTTAKDIGEEVASFRTLAIGKSLSGVYYDFEGNTSRISAGSSNFSREYKSNVGQKVSLYRQLPPAKSGLPPIKHELVEFVLDKPIPYIVLFQVNPKDTNDVRVKVVEDSWDDHPVGTMRLFNYSPRLVMVKIGSETAQLATAESKLFPYSDNLQVWIQAIVLDGDEWSLRLSTPQVIMPNTRSTLILVDQLPTIGRPESEELLVRNFVEPAPVSE